MISGTLYPIKSRHGAITYSMAPVTNSKINKILIVNSYILKILNTYLNVEKKKPEINFFLQFTILTLKGVFASVTNFLLKNSELQVINLQFYAQ